VIDEPGFTFWLWVVLILSLLIIVLGIYGMYAAIDRRRKSLIIVRTLRFKFPFNLVLKNVKNFVLCDVYYYVTSKHNILFVLRLIM
jgi:hypothetical protein